MDIHTIKHRAFEAIEKNKEKIIAIGDSIYKEPELGYKEFKTAAKIKEVFKELGFEYEDELARTGVIARRKGKSSKISLAIMGELDAVVSPEHPKADKITGAAHCCGHHAMIASLIGVAYAIHDGDIMKDLDGDIVLMAVPAEEYVEIEFRNELIQQGEITFVGGKQEFIKLGIMDDIDMMIMQHTGNIREDKVKTTAYSGSNGFVGKLIRYEGKEAHAGATPHLGINALNAAQLGLLAVNAQRETFKDADRIRVHPIITKGGDLVNVVPADVRLETYIRGATLESIVDTNEKVTRAFTAGGDAVGATTHITDIPGYLPVVFNKDLGKVYYDNAVVLLGREFVELESPAGGFSSDVGDISYLMPTIQASMYGATGLFHSKTFELADTEVAYIDAAKCLIGTAIDLLGDGAAKGMEIVRNNQPLMTKEAYLETWGQLGQK